MIEPPKCAVCNRQVEKFYHESNYRNDSEVFIAECHGEKQVVELGRCCFEDGAVSVGLAFNNKLLTDLVR